MLTQVLASHNQLLQVILSPKWKKESQIVVLGNVKGLRRCILETMVSLEELLWKVHGAVAKETFCKKPLQKLFPLEVGGTEQVPARPEANIWQRLSQEKLEEEKSISFFKNKRTPFKGRPIEGGKCRNSLSFLNLK